MKIDLFKLSAVIGLALVLSLTNSAMAENIVTMEGTASGTLSTLDSSPVITNILSQPGTVNGKTYTSWSFMVNDGTGSAVVFGALPSGSTYVPTVGDAITVAGKYSPFHLIPELGTLTAISAVSSGNAVPAPTVITIPDINVAVTPQNLEGYMLELDNVTISGQPGPLDGSNSPAGAKITDGSGNNMTFYYWPTSYSVANANLTGMAVPTGPVNMTGFVSVYSGTAEFTPMTITSVPEPSVVALLVLAGLGLVFRFRRGV